MGNLLKFFIVLGIVFIFIGYGTDKLLQTFTGVTFLQGDTLDNEVVSLRTGITVIEYEDHLLVKQSAGYIHALEAFKYMGGKFATVLQGFLPEFLEMDITSDVSTFDVIIMFLMVASRTTNTGSYSHRGVKGGWKATIR